ncbi:AsmA-like C-terminal region-containing protein [Belliella kenyensis]|uniref:AsmA-like C-terminal region-containing protein n=1 Tax=Belliella kenyensis TaxID=1472724 RepID=A0ABV8EK59_9BACT|nr:AsmA-like C-terminal region-containing protein [Belliella kenyensis]MCH7403029.1 membrane biogenesis protein [Belliella kenyensis]MDN3605065.1 AsmA-like C-terminal region-containing protein [Belliella kenyensis]
MNRKKIIYLSLFLLVPILLFVIALGVIYSKQREITQNVLSKINEEFIGELVIADSYISPFASFPYISIDLQNIQFFENKEMNTKPIYEAKDLYLGFNVWDVLRGKYEVKKLKIEDGHLDLIQYENGDINLLLAKGLGNEEEDEEDSDAFAFDLDGFELNKFELTYSNLSTNQDLVFHIDRLKSNVRLSDNQTSLGVVTDLIFDLDENGENTFFADKHMSLDLKLDYFSDGKLLKISPSKLKLEGALLALNGEIILLDDGMDLDLKLDGEKPDFNIFAAFLPNETAALLSRYKNEGEVFFTGSVRGKTGPGLNPAVSIEFGADNAYFLNTSIQKKVDELRFTGFYTNGSDRNLKTSEIQLQHFHARPDEGIFQGRMVIRNFEDPYVKINLNADLDLEFLGAFFEIEGLRGIQGQVLLDMDFDELVDIDFPPTTISSVEGSLQSKLQVKNLSLTIPDYHLPVKQANAYAYMRKGKVVLDSLSFKIGDSDFAFSGELNDFSAMLHQTKSPVKVKFNSKSNQIKLNQLIKPDSSGKGFEEEIKDFEVKMAFESTGRDLMNFEHVPLGEFFIEDFHAKLKNFPHKFHDFHADILIKDNELQVKDFKGEIDDTDFVITGKFSNYKKWFEEEKNGDSSFDFDLASKKLQLNDLLTYDGVNYLPEDYADEVITDLKLNGRVDLHYLKEFKSADFYLNQLSGKLNIHPLKLENFDGRVHFEDSYLTVEKLGGKMGVSDFKIDMGYFIAGIDSIPKSKVKRNYFRLNSQVLDLDALMGFEGFESETNHQDSFNIFQLPFSEMEFSANIGKLNYHKFWLENVKANARTTSNHYLYLDTLSMNVASGFLAAKGYFNGSNPEEIYFHSDLVADKLDLDKLLFKFENFGQDYLINENLHGLVSGKIKSKFLVYPDLTPIIDKSEASMDLTVYQGSLVNFAPLDAMASYFGDRNLKNVRFDTLSNTFELKQGVLHIPSMNINSSLGFIELSGRQSLDLNMDYFIRVPLAMVTQVGFRALFGGKNKTEIDPDQEDDIVYRDQDKRVRFVNINMKGTPDDYKISLGKEKK